MAKLTDAAEKKFQSVVHHHENIIKSAQRHWMAPGALCHDVLDEILNHTLCGNETKHCLLRQLHIGPFSSGFFTPI
jgi:hypothetical protein